ncbi:uncharacterized protein B0H18DRAFT_958497 [Fomitopsis serialis]|uniref:uncharacterized protein n=1 Tax=Fomitopsis serialis TaxID=139415 RepID=UPI002008332C|nr:uncharacterized protein B0H18DRAFT_958497 [Neoantrodia serialis]KAH9917207.1 hypothetical protein B0H18DRAFT_958497 [Neoantrodia serialis]
MTAVDEAWRTEDRDSEPEVWQRGPSLALLPSEMHIPPFRHTLPSSWKPWIGPPLEHRARGYYTPELHNWSPPRGVVPYSCFFRSAYSLASSHSEHRQAHTIHSINFPPTTEVYTGTVYRRAEVHSLHYQSTIIVHAEPTPMRDADVVARTTSTVRLESITDSATSRLGGDSTYTFDELFTASTSAPQTYEQATGPGPATATYEPGTAHAGGAVTQSTDSRNHSAHEGRHAARTDVTAEGQRLETMIQERAAVHTRSNLIEDASRARIADAHVVVRSHFQRGTTCTLRDFWLGVASLTAGKHEGATPHESLTMTTRPGTNTSGNGLSIREQALGSGDARRGVTVGSRGGHAMDIWRMYMGDASSTIRVPTDTSGSTPPLLDELFLEILGLTARTFGRFDGPAGNGLVRMKAAQISDAIPTDTSVSPTNAEQAMTHQHNASERVAAARRGRDEQSARRTSQHQFGLYECVMTEDERATSGGGACRVNVSLRTLEKSGYESRRERSTGRPWSPASNRAREQGIQRAEATSEGSIEYKDMRERKEHAREASEQTQWAKAQTTAETHTTDRREYKAHRHGAEKVGKMLAAPRRVEMVEDDHPRLKERTGTENRALGQARDVMTEVRLTGRIATRSDASLAEVGHRHRTPFGEILASIRGDREGTDAAYLVDQGRTYEDPSVSDVERGIDGRIGIPGCGTGGASSEQDESGPRERDSRRAGVACKNLAATGIAQGRGFDGELGRDEERIAGGEASSGAISACSGERQEVGEFLAAARRVFKAGNDWLRLYQQAARVSRGIRRVAKTSLEDRHTGRCHTTRRGPFPSQAEESTSTPRGVPRSQTEGTHASGIRQDTLGRDGATAEVADTRKQQERQAQGFRRVTIRATDITLTYGMSSADYAYPGHSSPSARTVLQVQGHATSAFELGVEDAPLLGRQRSDDGRDCDWEHADLARVQRGNMLAMDERRYDEIRSEDHKQPQAESVERGLRRETIAQALEPQVAQPTGASLVTQVADLARAFPQLPHLLNASSLSVYGSTCRGARSSVTAHACQTVRSGPEGTAREEYVRERHDRRGLTSIKADAHCGQSSGAQGVSVSAQQRTDEWEWSECDRMIQRRAIGCASESPEHARLNERDAAGLGLDTQAPRCQLADPATANPPSEGMAAHGLVSTQESVKQANRDRDSQVKYSTDSSSPSSKIVGIPGLASGRTGQGDGKDGTESLVVDTERASCECRVCRREQDELQEAAGWSTSSRIDTSEAQQQDTEGTSTIGRVSLEDGLTESAPTISRTRAGPLFSPVWGIAIGRKGTVSGREASIGTVPPPEQTEGEDREECAKSPTGTSKAKADTQEAARRRERGGREEYWGVSGRWFIGRGGKRELREGRHAKPSAASGDDAAEEAVGEPQDQELADSDWAGAWLDEPSTPRVQNQGPRTTEVASRKIASRIARSSRLEGAHSRRERGDDLEPREQAAEGIRACRGASTEEHGRTSKEDRARAEETMASVTAGATVALNGVSESLASRDGGAVANAETHRQRRLGRTKDENGIASMLRTENSAVRVPRLSEKRFKTIESERGVVWDEANNRSGLGAELNRRGLGTTIARAPGLWSGRLVRGLVVPQVMDAGRVFSRFPGARRNSMVDCSLVWSTVWQYAARPGEGIQTDGVRAVKGLGVGRDTRELSPLQDHEVVRRIDRAMYMWTKQDHGSVSSHRIVPSNSKRIKPSKGALEPFRRDTNSSKAAGSPEAQVRPETLLRSGKARFGKEQLVEEQASEKETHMSQVATDVCVESEPNERTGEATMARDSSPGNEPSESDEIRLGVVVSEAADGCVLDEPGPREASDEECREAKGGCKEIQGMEPSNEQGSASNAVGEPDGGEGHLPSERKTSGWVDEDVEATGNGAPGPASRDVALQQDEVERYGGDGPYKEHEQGQEENVTRGNAYAGSVQCGGASLELSTGEMTRERIDHRNILRARGLASSGTSLQMRGEDGRTGEAGSEEPLGADGPARAHGETDQDASLLLSNEESKPAGEGAGPSEMQEVARQQIQVRTSIRTAGENGRTECRKAGEHTKDSEGEVVPQEDLVEISQPYGLKANFEDVRAHDDTKQGESLEPSRGKPEPEMQGPGPSDERLKSKQEDPVRQRAYGGLARCETRQTVIPKPSKGEVTEERSGEIDTRYTLRLEAEPGMSSCAQTQDGQAEREETGEYALDGGREVAILQVNLLEISQPTELWADWDSAGDEAAGRAGFSRGIVRHADGTRTHQT